MERERELKNRTRGIWKKKVFSIRASRLISGPGTGYDDMIFKDNKINN